MWKRFHILYTWHTQNLNFMSQVTKYDYTCCSQVHCPEVGMVFKFNSIIIKIKAYRFEYVDYNPQETFFQCQTRKSTLFTSQNQCKSSIPFKLEVKRQKHRLTVCPPSVCLFVKLFQHCIWFQYASSTYWPSIREE